MCCPDCPDSDDEFFDCPEGPEETRSLTKWSSLKLVPDPADPEDPTLTVGPDQSAVGQFKELRRAVSYQQVNWFGLRDC